MKFATHLMLDEADEDPVVAAALAREIGAEACAVRIINGRRYPFVTEADHNLLQRLRLEGLKIHSLSPGIGKKFWDGGEAALVEFEQFPFVVDCAKRLGASDISIFSWLKTATARPPKAAGHASPDAPHEEIAALLRRLGDLAGTAGLTLSVEVGYQCWADSGQAVWRLLEAARHPALQIAWDPCNSWSGLIWWSRRNPAPFPLPHIGDYLALDLAALPDRISAVHLRDMIPFEGDPGWAYVLPGHGAIDWPDLMARLRARGYHGPLTIEHHMPSAEKARSTRHAAAFLHNLHDYGR